MASAHVFNMFRLSDKIKTEKGSSAMKMQLRTAKILLFVLLALAVLATASCSRMGESTLKLQPNPPLSGGIGWAVVKDAYVRLKEGPSDSTQDIDHLRRGSVYRLDAREFGAGDDTARASGRDVWYGIDVEGAKGWIRDSELEYMRPVSG